MLVVGHQGGLIVVSATDLSQMTRLDVFLQSRSASSPSNFAFLEVRWLYIGVPPSGLGLEARWQVRREPSQTPSGLVANSLATVQDASIIGPLYILDVIFAEDTRDVRFGLVTVVGC